MTLHQALTAAFLPDCRDAVERGTLTGTTAEAMADELALAVTLSVERTQRLPRPNTIRENVVYQAIIKVCEGRERFMRRDEGGEGYSGNGHHWAQRLTTLAVESGEVQEAWGWR